MRSAGELTSPRPLPTYTWPVASVKERAAQEIARRFRIGLETVDYWARVADEESRGGWPPIEPRVQDESGWTPETVDSFIRASLAHLARERSRAPVVTASNDRGCAHRQDA
jgi:hypothetical protein